MVTHVLGNSNLSREVFAIDTWGAVICSLGHGRKHMLRILPTTWRPGLKVLSQTVPDFGDSYDECEHEILLVWDGTMSVNMRFACLRHRGCLILSLLATKA